MQFNFDARGIAILLGVLFFSASLHELMHALVAYRLGDDLAHSRGRISLNPLVHIDPYMTILLPLIMVAVLHVPPIMAAKPVPINSSRLKWGDTGMALVGLAGPLTNLALAIIAGGVLRVTSFGGLGYDILSAFLYLNIALFVFNMIPFPPLDGSRVLYAFAPESVQRVMEQIESFGIFGVIILITLFSSSFGPVLGSIIDALTRLLSGH